MKDFLIIFMMFLLMIANIALYKLYKRERLDDLQRLWEWQSYIEQRIREINN